MKILLNTYLRLEEMLNMEYMLKEQIYMTYYEKLSDFKYEMFFLDNKELIRFIDDYLINKNKLTQDFIMLNDRKLDSYIIWNEEDDLDMILNYFLNHQNYNLFIA